MRQMGLGMHRHGDMGTQGHRYPVTWARGDTVTPTKPRQQQRPCPIPPHCAILEHVPAPRWQRLGDSTSVARWPRDVAMLRLLVASAHIPGATGSGPGLHVSARFRGTAGYKGGDTTVAVPMGWVASAIAG